MKKLIVMFYLCLLPFDFAYPQSLVDSDCNVNIENIFKALTLKVRYECTTYFHEESKKGNSCIQTMPKEMWDYYLMLIKGFPHKDSISGVNSEKIANSKRNFEEYQDSISRVKPVLAKRISEEELNSYLEQMGTPDDAFKEYKDLIQKIKSEKKVYLECIDITLAKNNSSKSANMPTVLYLFPPPDWSFVNLITKLNFLKILKEFIFNDNEDVLPELSRVCAYLDSLK